MGGFVPRADSNFIDDGHVRLCSLDQMRKHRCKSSFESRFFNLHVGEKLDSLAGVVFTGWELLIVIIAFRFFETLEEFDIVNAFRYLDGLSLLFEHTFRVPGGGEGRGAIC